MEQAETPQNVLLLDFLSYFAIISPAMNLRAPLAERGFENQEFNLSAGSGLLYI